MKTIAYQGAKGAFSYMTGLNQFGIGNKFTGLQTFREVFDLVEKGEADFAVIPIENSLIGSIYENYDLLNNYEMRIVAEQYTRIEHCLLSVPSKDPKEEQLKKIKRVLSHPKALEQCTWFFEKHPWIEAVVFMDTAAAAAEVATLRDPTTAAIASELAGDLYGLDILEKGIEDDDKNYTRFVIVAKKEMMDHREADKCSLLLQLKHEPGSLADVLKLFASNGMNLSKIESRPLRGIPFEYGFYIDLEFPGKERHEVVEIFHQLCARVRILKILGFYKKGTLWMS